MINDHYEFTMRMIKSMQAKTMRTMATRRTRKQRMTRLSIFMLELDAFIEGPSKATTQMSSNPNVLRMSTFSSK